MVLEQTPFSSFPHTKRNILGLGGLLSSYSTCREEGKPKFGSRELMWVPASKGKEGVSWKQAGERLEIFASSGFDWETVTQRTWHNYGGQFLTPTLGLHLPHMCVPTHMQTWIHACTPYTQMEIIKGNNVLNWVLFFVLCFKGFLYELIFKTIQIYSENISYHLII